MENFISVVLPWPDAALSPNSRVHWAEKAKTVRRYKNTAYMLTKCEVLIDKFDFDGDVSIEMHFFRPTNRKYDQDNLVARMKSALDGISAALGINDCRFHIKEPVIHPANKKDTELRAGGVMVNIEKMAPAKKSDTNDFQIGDTVETPTGRPARIIKFVFGPRGSLCRAFVRYLDTKDKRETATLQPSLLKRIEG